MDNKKPTSVPHPHKHHDGHPNLTHKLEGVVKNKGIKPVRKEKKEIARLFRSKKGVTRLLLPEWLSQMQELEQGYA